MFPEQRGLGVLASQLTQLVNMDRDGHSNVNILISFCRHCADDYMGVLPRRIRYMLTHGLIRYTLTHGRIRYTLTHGRIRYTLTHGRIRYTLTHGTHSSRTISTF